MIMKEWLPTPPRRGVMHLRVLYGKEHRPSYFELSKPFLRGRGRIHVYVGIVQTLKQKYGI